MPRSDRHVALAALVGGGLAIAVAGTALAAVSWSSAALPPANAFNRGDGLARSRSTASGALTAYLQAQYTVDQFASGPAKDTGPFMGVYHSRRSDTVSDATWSSRLRLNPTSQHGDRGAVAAAGRNVYVAWVSIESYEQFDPDAARALYMRANGNHGASASWGSTWQLAGPICQVPGDCDPPLVDAPSLAASGDVLLVAYTEGNEGKVTVVRGVYPFEGFTAGIIGTTTRQTPEGLAAHPAVGLSPSTQAIAWLSDGSGTVRARVGPNGGAWGNPVTLGSGATSPPHVSVVGGRVAVVWINAGGLRLRIWKAGSWQPTRTVSAFSSTGTFKAGYSPAVTLAGSSSVGIAWSDCRRGDCEAVANSTAGVDLAWRESTNDGASWLPKRTLVDSRSYANGRRNDHPTVVWSSTTRRNVLHTRSSFDHSYERLFLRTGVGTP